MTYIRSHRPVDRVTTLVAVGALHAVGFYAVIAGLSVAFVPRGDPPPISATNSPLPTPVPTTIRPEPRPHSAHLPDPPLPTPLPTIVPQPLPTPLTVEPAIRDSGAGGGSDLPDTRPTTPVQPARAARPIGQPGTWITEADYPTSEIRLEHAGVVGFSLEVSASGTVSRCTVVRPSGFAALDQLTCALLVRRSRFQPASDEHGQPVPGRFTSAVRWQLPD